VGPVYNFPVLPVVSDVKGCGPGGFDPDVPDFVQTVNCPTIGGLRLTLTGANLVLPLAVAIGGFAASTINATADGSTLFVMLPTGSGTQLSVTVTTIGGIKSLPLLNALSYAPPRIISVSGCDTPNVNSSQLSLENCNRTGTIFSTSHPFLKAIKMIPVTFVKT
jgi:hypothetical protein